MSTVSSTTASTYTTSSTASTDQVTNPDSTLTGDDFLQMLITQLKNQDPLDVTDSNTMIANETALSSVSQLTDLNTNIVSLMTMENTSQAAALVGKTVTVTTNSTTGATTSGTVSSVKFVDGTPKIVVNDTEYSLSAVTEITA
jgi:flagellar basal-body rod modification protein FlgD